MTPDITRRNFILVGSAAAGAGVAYMMHEEDAPASPPIGGSTAGRGTGKWLTVAANEVREIGEQSRFNGVTIRPGGVLRFDVGDSLTVTGGD